MAAPTANWAGTFSCSECGRSRLIASDFSKKQVEKRQKEPQAAIRCKACVDGAAAREREAAAARQAAHGDSGGSTCEMHECAACGRQRSSADFNRTQCARIRTRPRG
jgi:hypothetical protein